MNQITRAVLRERHMDAATAIFPVDAAAFLQPDY